jgi:hypothetical protein
VLAHHHARIEVRVEPGARAHPTVGRLDRDPVPWQSGYWAPWVQFHFRIRARCVGWQACWADRTGGLAGSTGSGEVGPTGRPAVPKSGRVRSHVPRRFGIYFLSARRRGKPRGLPCALGRHTAWRPQRHARPLSVPSSVIPMAPAGGGPPRYSAPNCAASPSDREVENTGICPFPGGGKRSGGTGSAIAPSG